MRLLRTRFRRRKNVGAGNQHVFAWRNLRNQIERGLVVKQATIERAQNLPGETNRQFAQRMRAQ